jgi:OFA family oxalate/formate antiporter-like MFS transporter
MTLQKPNHRGWTVVLAALSINLILGVLYAWSIMAKALQTDPQWHWTKSQTALPFSVATACFALTMIFAGRWQDKIGPRWVATLGGCLLGAGLCASAAASSPGTMLVTFGLVGGIGIGLGYSATTPPSLKWFPPARKGLITGIVVSGVGLAAVYISPLTQYLLKTTGSIPKTFLFLGIGAIVLVAALSQLLTNPPAGYVPAAAPAKGAAASAKAAPGKRDLDWHEMLATKQFYLLWVMFVLSASAGLMIIAHVATIAKDQAHVDKWGFLPVATLAIFNTLGRVLSGFLSDRIGRTRTMVGAFALQAVNMFLFSQYTTPGLIVFGAAFTGLCYGTIFTLFPATAADFYGVRNLGVNYGLLFTGFGVAGVFGPILGGKVRDIYGSYSHSFTVSAILLLAGAALAFLVKPPGASVQATGEAPAPAREPQSLSR